MLSPEAQNAIKDEQSTLTTVLVGLEAQRKRSIERLAIESERARALTSAIVATRRDEDKQLLASDEAVSHSLRDKKEAEINTLDGLVKKPYFARFIVEEETDAGQKSFEYRIGFAENAECRIIDWRKAPIAKLYYEYKEGDEYSEEILGKERVGQVTLRNGVEIQNGALQRISCRYGNFIFENGEWKALGEPLRGRQAARADSPDGDGHVSRHLPQVAALLTPEQFELVSGSSDSAMLIQGVAGSGKTTVALHRLAWLVGAADHAVSPGRAPVLVLSAPLREYISRTLPSLGVEGVRTYLLGDWLAQIVGGAFPRFVAEEAETSEGRIITLRRPDSRSSLSIDRLKRSLAMLQTVEKLVLETAEPGRSDLQPQEVILRALAHPQTILANDETKLIDLSLIKEARAKSEQNFAANTLEPADDALFVRIIELTRGDVHLGQNHFGKFDHIVADEVQDFSPVELASVIGAAHTPSAVTLVGDTAQKVDATSAFPGWDKLRRFWAFKDSMATFVSLNLSHRSTLPILKLADYVQRRDAHSKAVEGRSGRTPIWFKCKNDQDGLRVTIDWLTKAGRIYPGSLSALLCRTKADAKFLYQLLQPTFGPMLRLGDEYTFTFYEGIVVTSVENIKGLEFTNVVLWNPSKKDYPADDMHRNLLYTAITRAEENLCITTFTRASDLLPPFNSALVRGQDLTQPEEEELDRPSR